MPEFTGIISHFRQPDHGLASFRHWNHRCSDPESGQKVRDMGSLYQAEMKARFHLRTRRLDSATVPFSEIPRLAENIGHLIYVINDEDVKEIVAIVAEVLAQTSFDSNLFNATSIRDERTKQYDSPATGLALGRHSIIPRISAPADPATTFSVPKTLFTCTNWRNREMSAAISRSGEPVKSTIVSRASVSEIVWTECYSSKCIHIPDPPSPLGSIDSPTEPNRIHHMQASKIDPSQNSMRDAFLERQRQSNSFESSSTTLAFRKRMSRSTDEDSNMTSFPELRPRHCTNDWLKPPAEIEQLVRVSSSDLYQRGVDAHCDIVPTCSDGR